MQGRPWERYGAPQSGSPQQPMVIEGPPRAPPAPPSGYEPAPGGGLRATPGGPADPRSTPASAPSGYRFTANGALEPIPGGPADPRSRPPRTRQLNAPAITSLEQGSTAVRDLGRLSNTFNDDFTGLGSSVENWAQRQDWLPSMGTQGQQQWWSDMSATDNALRNALFGASLTAGESEAWRATTVEPGMPAVEIRRNLARRLELARELLGRRGRTFRAGGFNEDQIRAALGEYQDLLEATPGQSAAQPEQRRDINGNVIPTAPPGTTVAFADDPTPPAGPWSPEQQEAYDAFMRANPRASADDIRSFARSVGIRDISNAEDIVRARDAGGGFSPGSTARMGEATPEARQTNYGVNYTPIPGGPTISVNTQGIDAAMRGGADVLSAGLSDEIAAAGDTIFGEGTYGENLWRQRGIDQFDERNNPGARFAGQAAGALALPSGVARAGLNSGRAALRGGEGMAAARTAATRGGARRLGLEGAGFGGAYGFGSADGGVMDRLSQGGISALIGGPTAYGLGRGIGGLLGRGGQNADRLDILETRRAADDLGMNMMPADVSGPFIRRMTGAGAQFPLSASPIISAGRRVVEQAEGVRDRVAGEIGDAVTPLQAGEAATRGAQVYRSSSRDAVGRAYDNAAGLAGDVQIRPSTAIEVLDRNIEELSQIPGGATGLDRLQRLRDELVGESRDVLDAVQTIIGRQLSPADIRLVEGVSPPPAFSIQGLRGMRTALRDDFLQQGLRGSDIERRVNQVVDAASEDIVAGLTAQGRGEAAQAYRAADTLHRERVDMIDNVLRPIIGRNGERSGVEVVRAIQSAMQANPGRARRFVDALPAEEQSTVRASLIGRLGVARRGQQNADGDVFSLETFLTNWNEMEPTARLAVFGEAGNRALGNLARVAAGSRQAGAYANRSQTGGVIGAGITGAGALGLSWGNLALAGLGQYAVGRLLASPVFARWLAREPGNPAQARQRIEQLTRMARTQPSIAAELLGVQRALSEQLEGDQPR